MNHAPRFLALFLGFSALVTLFFSSTSYATRTATSLSDAGNYYIAQNLESGPAFSKQQDKNKDKTRNASTGKPPVIRHVSPRRGATVTGTPTTISGTFNGAGGAGIDVKTVKMTLAGTDVTQSAIITPQFFAYRADLTPGSYPVEITGKHMSGNSMRYAWTFNVASEEPAAAGTLPLEIFSHADNEEVGGGVIILSGRTAPDARVDVQLRAFSALAGLGLTQQAVNQSMRADVAGNFSFDFEPKVAVPGTRYEFIFTAVKDESRTEMKLILFQKK